MTTHPPSCIPLSMEAIPSFKVNKVREAKIGDIPESHAQEHVEATVKRAKTSFYWAMRRLSKDKRNAMFAVYAFCRQVDDVADEPGLVKDKRARLSQWRKEIDRLYQGDPTLPVTKALEGPVSQFDLKQEDFRAVIDGMEMDARSKLRIKDQAELDLYCDRVACAVGRLSNRIFGINPKIGDRVASALGKALQLTNILRDLAEDAKLNRLYLPKTMLHENGITDDEPEKVLRHPALPQVCALLTIVARRRFQEAAELLERCDPKKIRPAVMMMETYRLIYSKLQERGWDKLDEPVKLSFFEKLWVLFRYGIL